VIGLADPNRIDKTPSDIPSNIDSSPTNIGNTITNSIGMKLVYIKPGTFQMGSNNGKPDEKPVHEVHISKGFYMSETEVTQDQWERVMGKEPKRDDNLVSVGANYPKVFVNMKDTQEFCQKLSELEKEHTYRLPTEAQWEYACRAGTSTEFNFGDDANDLENFAWYNGNTTDVYGLYSAHEVAQKKPNKWGLYDMHGNVAERCRDNYDENYYSNCPINDPESKSIASLLPSHVVRGGWSGDTTSDCRSACRKEDKLGLRYNSTGFRVILKVDNSIGHSEYDKTFKALEAEAHQGKADAQNSLGSMYAAGQGVAQNYEEATKWFRKAADQGHADAQFNLGKAYASGQGIPRDFKEAAEWYVKAADQGNANAQNSLGSLYDSGLGVPQDHAEAMKWYRKAADQGHNGALFNLGYNYERGQGVPRDYVEAIKWYRKAADQGYANAQNSLGFMYGAGRGVTQNHEEAAKWFRMAADQGFGAAQFNLGNAYAEGRGVSQDPIESAKWCRKAADQGFAFAEYQLGFKYIDGKGVPEDINEAVKWFRKAADHGIDDAQFRTGLAYENGISVTQSHEEAAKWYRKAADQGHADAQSKLGIMYYNGLGVSKDYVLSYMWFTLSGQMAKPVKTTTEAINAQTDLVDKMTQDQKNEANKLVREWKSNH
jgi:TPR repeat protein